jgi:hypothetical protein
VLRLRVLHLVLAAGALGGSDPAPAPIRLPVLPAPMPPPPPAPIAVAALASDQLYVIDSDVPCIVLASPAGVVAVSEDSGPIKMRGKFVDGKGSEESRTYTGKAVYTIQATGNGRVELLIVPVGGGKDAVIRRTLDVGQSAPPVPVPPSPGPKPAPTPAALWGFVVVEDTAEAVAGRGAMLTDPALAALMKAKGYRYRVVDRDVQGPDGSPPADVAPCLNAARGKTLPQVFLIDSKGAIVLQSNLTDAAGLVSLLKQWGQ